MSSFTYFPGWDNKKNQNHGKGHESFMPKTTYGERVDAVKKERKLAGKAPKPGGIVSRSGKGSVNIAASPSAQREETIMAINNTRMSLATPPMGARMTIPAASIDYTLIGSIQAQINKGPTVVSGATLFSAQAMDALKKGDDKIEDKILDTPINAPIAIKMKAEMKAPQPSSSSIST
jgi:hypothetical protein